jgi:hypothetical protein
MDTDLLMEQFTRLESRSDQMDHGMASQNAAHARRLRHQFAVLSAHLFPGVSASEEER